MLGYSFRLAIHSCRNSSIHQDSIGTLASSNHAQFTLLASLAAIHVKLPLLLIRFGSFFLHTPSSGTTNNARTQQEQKQATRTAHE
jgi:hypothetical protein